MRRLVCAFAVSKSLKTDFLASRPILDRITISPDSQPLFVKIVEFSSPHQYIFHVRLNACILYILISDDITPKNPEVDDDIHCAHKNPAGNQLMALMKSLPFSITAR